MPVKPTLNFESLMVFLCLLIPTCLEAQIVQRFPFSLSVNASINLTKQAVVINEVQGLENNRIKDINLSLKEGELIISYKLDKATRGDFYEISVAASIADFSIPIRPSQLIGDIGIVMEASASQNYQIIWPNFTQQFLLIEDDFKLTIQATYAEKLKVAGLDCDNPPQFGFKQQWPFLATLVVAGGSIGAGQYYKRLSDDTYNNQYLNAASLAEANPLYEKANQEHHQYLIFTYSGLALVAGDMIWYIVRSARHQKRLKLFDEYCKPGQTLNLDPVFSPGIGQNPVSTQLRLTFSF